MTERRRKTRTKELKHGDLFHVYIASDTPPEVCAFLSRLKQQGDFSYEILQIIEDHVHSQVAAPKTSATVTRDIPVAQSDLPPVQQIEDVGIQTEPLGGIETPQTAARTTVTVDKSVDTVSTSRSSDELTNTPVEAVSATASSTVTSVEEQSNEPVKPQKKIDPIQLLRQQRRAWVENSGKASAQPPVEGGQG